MMDDSYLHKSSTEIQEKKVPGTNQSKVYSSPSRYKGRPLSQKHFDSLRSLRLDYLEHISLNHPRELIKMDASKIFQGEPDNYDGVTVTIAEPMDAAVFTEKLRASLSHWRQEGKKGIWINLPIRFANLVEAAVSEGFRYHHAEPDYLMLVSWIPNTRDTIPANASHVVGVGALVLNKNTGEVLVVQEKSGYFRNKNVWKLPTGVVNEVIYISFTPDEQLNSNE
ncbi:hypothetical protein YC2023_002329 [Brassica napus]